MIKVEDDGIGTQVHIEGRGFTVLHELSVLCANLIEDGIPLEILEASLIFGQKIAEKKGKQTEDEKLAENFMEELMRRVKEKREEKCTD